jgi:hypothetical protein
MQRQGARSSGERGTTSLSVANLSVANRASDTQYPLTFPQCLRRESGHPAAPALHFGEGAPDCGFVTFILQCNV